MERTIQKDLLFWKSSYKRKPLLVRGARQVGKTWSIRDFGKNYFENLIIVDLEKNTGFHDFFKEDLNPVRIKQTIELALNTNIIPGKSLLFFDEIQSCPRAIMSLRYFYEELPDLHVIAAGSLIEFVLSKISFPVGRVDFLSMYPLTFSEFLLAKDNIRAYEIINSLPNGLGEAVHNIILKEFNTYLLTGGMPASVCAFLDTGSLVVSKNICKDLIFGFKEDFRKYNTRTSIECLEEVFENTAANIGNQISYTGLSRNFSHPTVKKAFNLLLKAGLVNKVNSISSLDLPFNLKNSSKKFKALFLDVGLWQNLCGMPVDMEIRKNGIMNAYRGALAEQFAGQEIAALIKGNPVYWARDAKSSSAEVDYAVEFKGIVYPVEVKSSSSGSLKSLHLALETYKNCPWGIVLSTRPFQILKEQKLMFVPIYYAGILDRICS